MAKRAGAFDPPASPGTDHMLSPEDLAAYLAVPLATVYRWRSRGDGPASYRVGRHVRYKLQDIEDWLQGRRVGPAFPGS
jgi:excisionase family DNA binding protein